LLFRSVPSTATVTDAQPGEQRKEIQTVNIGTPTVSIGTPTIELRDGWAYYQSNICELLSVKVRPGCTNPKDGAQCRFALPEGDFPIYCDVPALLDEAILVGRKALAMKAEEN
jgi:hypothetical protein